MRISVRHVRLAVLLAGAAATVAAGLIAYSPQLDRIVLSEIAELAPVPQGRAPATDSLPPLVHAAGYSPGYARRTLVPAMRGSVAVGDIDGDSQPELYISDPAGVNLLLRNFGNGRFRDIAKAANVTGMGASLSATFSDYDRSGRPSLFVVGADGITLYRNNGNRTFSDVTRKAGLARKPGELYTSAALGDFDVDGFPDLLVAVYTDLDRSPAKPSLMFPNDFSGADSRLYRNNRDGTFLDVTASMGLARNPGRARKAIFADFNNDQKPDILILRDDKPPVLYLNRGGRFENTTWEAGDALTRHAFFDAAVTDLNRDGKLDIVLWSTLSFRALLNRGNAIFDQEKSLPLITPLLSPFGFHGMVADLDENGFDDVVAVGEDNRVHAFVNYAGTFKEVPLELPAGFESGSFAPLPLKEFRGGHLLAVHSGGRVALLGLKHESKRER